MNIGTKQRQLISTNVVKVLVSSLAAIINHFQSELS